MNGIAGKAGQKAQAMDKVYTQVQELLIKYGVPFDKLLQLAKSGKLTLYTSLMPFEYEAINSFDCYVDNWINIERERLTRQYNSRPLYYPDERVSLIRSLRASMSRYGGGERDLRVTGQDEIAKDRYKRALNSLEDRDRVARELAIYLFVKTSDYVEMANSGNSPIQRKRKNTEIRKQETLEACKRVENLYRAVLPVMLKPNVLSKVKDEMNGKTPYKQTFDDWYTACPFTRGPGNPHNRKKST